MSVVVSTSEVTLRDEEGVLRIGESRVSLDSVVIAFNQGSTPEEIVFDYSSLNLSQVYAVISYYLQHRDEVDNYLAKRKVQRAKLRKEIEARHDSQGIRERLLARRRDAA
ncbi:MAG: DUF433 domain-containing protein [Pyrinomonadaceae bacterium]